MENQYLRDHVVLISVKVLLGLCVLGYMSSLLGSSEEKYLMEKEDEEGNSSTLAEIEVPLPAPMKKPIVLQPHCEIINSHVILRLILNESFQCKPGDADKEKLKSTSPGKKRKIRHYPKSKSETTESMVVYVAVGLLLISLGAALLEVFKFPNEPNIKTKPALNRSCSLADLTVMRHNRKELMRRDSVLDGNLESRGPSKLLGRKVSRPLLRLE